jgi:hypothetical protein
MWRVIGWVAAMVLLAALIVGMLRLGASLRNC